MKKILKLIALSTATTMLAGCGVDMDESKNRTVPTRIADHLYESTYFEWNEDKANALAAILRKLPDFEEIIKKYSSFTKLIEDYYETYLEFLSEESAEYLKQLYDNNLLEDFYESLFNMSCTSVRSGNFIGRNFDWTYDDIDEYIIKVPADEAKHRNASIGVAHCFFPTAVQKLIGMEDIIPMLTMDGINDKGVAINVNVVVSDSECCGDTWGTFINAPETEYCTGDLCTGFVVRYILDHAFSAANAVYLLEHANIYSVVGQEFHYMISDENESYVCEFINNNLIVLKGKGKNAAMSNFHVTHSPHVSEYEIIYPAGLSVQQTPVNEQHIFNLEEEHNKLVSDKYFRYPLGIERYERVKETVSSVNSMGKMLENMQKVWYKKMYTPGNEQAYWSDINFHLYEKDGELKQFSYYDDESLNSLRMEEFKTLQQKYSKIVEFEKQTGLRTPADVITTGLCQTVHTSAYDINAKKLSVNVQELAKTYEFSL